MNALLEIFIFAPVLLNITMSLYSLFANIFSQDEDSPDSVPTDDNIDYQPSCMIHPLSSTIYRGEHLSLLSTTLIQATVSLYYLQRITTISTFLL